MPRGILAAAEGLGRPIARIVLTHAHTDHSGSLDALAGRLPGVEIAVSAREARLLAGDRCPRRRRARLEAARGMAQGRPSRRRGSSSTATGWDRCASSRRPATRRVTSPCFDERDGTLIAGDAFSTLGGVSTTGRINPRFPLVGMSTWDRPTENRTAAMLRTLAPTALAVGHGPVVADPAAAIDRALAAVGAGLPVEA